MHHRENLSLQKPITFLGTQIAVHNPIELSIIRGHIPPHMNKEGDIMPDLTLDEYKRLSEEELEQILKKEARIICGSDSLKDNLRETPNDLYSLPHPEHRKAVTPSRKS